MAQTLGHFDLDLEFFYNLPLIQVCLMGLKVAKRGATTF